MPKQQAPHPHSAPCSTTGGHHRNLIMPTVIMASETVSRPHKTCWSGSVFRRRSSCRLSSTKLRYGGRTVYLAGAIILTALQIFPGSAQPARNAVPDGQPVVELKLNRSVVQLVAHGWQIVAVSQAGPILAYHLTQGGKLVICYLNLSETPMNSSCYQLDSPS